MRVHQLDFLMLELDPMFEETWRLNSFSSKIKKARAAFGLKQHSITMANMDGSFDDLMAAIQRFAPRN